MKELQEADKIIKEYSEPNSLIDSGNLFYAATEYKKAYERAIAKCHELNKQLNITVRSDSEQVSSIDLLNSTIYPEPNEDKFNRNKIKIILKGNVDLWQDFQAKTINFGEGKEFDLIKTSNNMLVLEAPGYGIVGNYGNGRIRVSIKNL